MCAEVDKAEGAAEVPRPTESNEAVPADAPSRPGKAQRNKEDAETTGKASEGKASESDALPRPGFRSLEELKMQFQKSRSEDSPNKAQADPCGRAQEEGKPKKASAEGKTAKASADGKAGAEIRAETKAEVKAAKAASAEKAAAKATAAAAAETKGAKAEGKKIKGGKDKEKTKEEENTNEEGNKEGKKSKAEKAKEKASKLALKSLEQLTKDFGKKRYDGDGGKEEKKMEHTSRPAKDGTDRSKKSRVGTLKKLVGGKGFGFVVPDDGSADVFLHFSDLMGSQDQRDRDMSLGMRVRYDPEVDPQTGKTRARNASIIEGSAEPVQQQPQEKQRRNKGDKESPDALQPRSYEKMELLKAFQVIRKRGGGKSRELEGVRGLTTVYMPRAKEPSDRRARLLEYAEENPDLDDESLLVKLEARLSRESGADAKNNETFGDCTGWSFEEAVLANEKLRPKPVPATAVTIASVIETTIHEEPLEPKQQSFQVLITIEDMQDRNKFEDKLSMAAAAVGISKDDIDTEYLSITDAHGRTFGLEHQPPGPPSDDMFPCVVNYEPPQAPSCAARGTAAEARSGPRKEESRSPQESERCASTAAPSAAPSAGTSSGSSAPSPALSRATTPVDGDSCGGSARASSPALSERPGAAAAADQEAERSSAPEEESDTYVVTAYQ